ncbi:MAG: hypothetical protein UT09_C0034G0002 [Parcubacteria group bacterium GW2011_GWF2_38_8]|nr:MAG: hypothetical protein UT09_C0034G0002 [Parcubacteria group bacterium GW2011_GWF2_38_8]
MKVLFVQSYLGHSKYSPVYPLGLAYISTASYQKGHEVQIFDPNTATNPYEDLAKCILNFSPEIIGISLRNIDNQYRIAPFYYYKHFQHLLEKINKTVPRAKVIVGGSGFSMFAEKIMERNPSIDFGIYLEGEENVPELLDNLNNPESVRGIYFRKEGKVLFTGFRPLPDFRKLPIPKRDFINITPYLNHIESLGLQTRRGCPLKCTYCNYPQLNGNMLRIREVKDICDEIEYLVKQYHIKQFMFADGVFNVPLKHSEELCEEIIKRGIEVKWSAWMELKHIPKHFLLLAIKAGCTNITFSPDAVSQSALNGLQKELNEKDIKDSLRIFIKDKDLRSLNVTYSLFVNPPGETFIGLCKTILFFIKAKLCFRGRGGPFLNWIRLEPETKAFQYALKKSVVPKNIDLLPNDENDLKNMFYSNPPLKHFDFLIIAILKFLPSLKKLTTKLFLKFSLYF